MKPKIILQQAMYLPVMTWPYTAKLGLFSMLRSLMLVIIFCCTISQVSAQVRTHIEVPVSEELHCIHFDQKGLLWIGTSAGVRSYDGYAVRAQFVNAIRDYPQLACDVRSLTTDAEGFIWAGTNDGLLRIDTKTAQIRNFIFPKHSQRIIYRLFTTREGVVMVGTDDGFSIYNKVKEEFEHFNVDNSNAVMPDGKTDRYAGWGVKDFAETPDGDILIGTWNQGLWRYSPKTKQIRGYAKMNWMNSAFTLHIDKNAQLWIGTQAYGVQRVKRLDDYKLETIEFVNSETANPLPHRVVYDLTEHNGGRIYAWTGDSICALIGPDGATWVATRFGGIERIQHGKVRFLNHAKGTVQSLFTDNGQQFFFGNGTSGLGWIDTETGKQCHDNQVPGFSSLPTDGTSSKRITSMVRRSNGELWIAAGDNGVLVSRPDGTDRAMYPRSEQMPYVKDNVIYLLESRRDQTLWIGGRQGISYLTKNGNGVSLNVKNDSIDLTGYFMVNHIAEDHDGNIWVSSANGGVVRIAGDPADSASLRFTHYMTPASNVTACFEDSRNELWAISPDGLMKFSPKKKCFELTEQTFHLTGKKILAINEDQYSALWLATDRALVRLDTSDGSTMSFTEQDGLVNTAFFPNATFHYGNHLFFGTTNGFISFVPEAFCRENPINYANLIVTDILIDGTSVLTLDSATNSSISTEQPMHTRSITIPASVKKFGVEFSLLSYTNQAETHYAYMLEGYDSDWQYVDGNVHRAEFELVPSGTYHFHLRAADCSGVWHELPYTITVRVNCPWYNSWAAYIVYVCLSAVLLWFIYNYLQMQHEMKTSRRFSAILQSAQIQIEQVETEVPEKNKGISALPSSLACQRNAEFVARATGLVREHIDDPDYNRDRMAVDLGMSVSKLYNRLHECTGLSIQVFIQTIRLNAAADILRGNPDIRISELAYRVGFNTPKYFSQCFKKEFGMLPGEYNKK